MPFYLFESKDGRIKEVFQKMSEPHVLIEDGVEWKRVFTPPQASIDTKIDPFSSKDFANKTGNKKGKLGDILDRSKECSDKRADKLGAPDIVKEKYFKNWSKKRGGKRLHPSVIAENQNKTLEIEFKPKN